MGLNDIAVLIDGYYCIISSTDNQKGIVLATLKYSPFTGEELPGALVSELRDQVYDSLSSDENDLNLLAQWKSHLSDYTPKFDTNLIPEKLKFLVSDGNWYAVRKERARAMHHGGNFCGELSGCFIECCYGETELPKLACVPIQYCPFCGAKLPPEFDQENWWEKEFKTFKWYKDHKMGEWADDYVDDCDWTEDDYPPIKEEK